MKRFGLSKKERIKKKKDFEIVYSTGSTLYSESKKFKVVFLLRKNTEQPEIKVAFGVFKKAGKAVWRNRVKRLMRESFRMNKLFLYSLCKEKNCSLLLVFSPNNLNQKKNRVIRLDEVQPEIVELIRKIGDSI
ncbi:MAG: ribonuclease P protein component [Ignavibacteria bacterium]|nr:MAG: ribonuclease P protein component [Ignavibacteria bacterium]